MDKIYIEESGMKFGPYNDNNVFKIEKSKKYQFELAKHGIRTVEFVLCRANKLLFLEAKTSTPDFTNREKSPDKKISCEEYINEIVEKYAHSLSLYFSMLIKRMESSEIPDNMRTTDHSNINIILVLVVKESHNESLAVVRDMLSKKLIPIIKIWNIKSVLALSEKKACEKGLVELYEPD